jgi:hypothetical protein
MQIVIKLILAAISVLLDFGVGMYLAFFFWLASVWMIDDSMAARFTPADWRYVAFERAAFGLLAASIFGLVSAIFLRFVFGRLFPERKRPSWMLAGFAGWPIAVGTIAGSIQFLIEKPYM